MTVQDPAAAERYLAQIGYYRLSAYWFPFKDRATKRYQPITNFDHIIWLYEWDRKLRLLAMDAIERIEIELRTLSTQKLADKYTPHGYYDPRSFMPDFGGHQHCKWLTKLVSEVERSSETFIVHHKKTYTNFPFVPLWVARETMSFGCMSIMLNGMHRADLQDVANHYQIPADALGSWTHALNWLRNVCAHHSRLWNRDAPVSPLVVRPTTKSHTTLAFPAPQSPKRSYHFLLVLRYLLEPNACAKDWKIQVVDHLHTLAPFHAHQVSMGLDPHWAASPYWT